MKYNFLRTFTVFIIVFLVTSLKAQDSLLVDNVLTSADSNTVNHDTVSITGTDVADNALDSSAAKSDTLLASAEIISDTGLAKREQPDSALLMYSVDAAGPETVTVIQPNIESEPAAVSEEVPLSVQSIEENDEKLTVNYNEAVKLFFAENKALRWIRANLLYMVFFFISVIVITAAVFFFSTKKDGRRFLTTTRLSVLDKMVQKGCRCIESNYMNPELTVDTVCSELVTGPAYLNALFVKEIGIDVQSFIVQVRVNSIRNLLAENPAESDLNKICVQCGFKTPAEAQGHFVALCGVGIEEYKKSIEVRQV